MIQAIRALAPTCCLLTLLAGAPADAHPAHVAIAEAEWNPQTGKLEVALRVRPEDLEEALTRMLRSDTRVDLDTAEDIDRHIAAYLRPRFVLQVDGRRQRLHWVGKEVDLRDAWLYFEIDAKEFQRATLSCTVLMDLLPEQLNTVLLREGRERTSYDFTRQETTRTIASNQSPPIDRGAINEIDDQSN